MRLLAALPLAVLALVAPAQGILSSPRLWPKTHTASKVHLPRAPSRVVGDREVVCPIFTEVCEHSGLTLTRYAMEFALANPELRDLTSIVASVQTACKSIAQIVRQGPLTGLFEPPGLRSTGGRRGARRCAARDLAEDVMRDALRFSGKIGVLASPEMPEPQEVVEDGAYEAARLRAGLGSVGESEEEALLRSQEGRFIATYAALDSCEEGQPAGTVFGIYAEDEEEGCPVPEDGSTLSETAARSCLARTLRPATALVAAGCCVYSGAVQFTLSLGAGAHTFTLDQDSGEFVLTRADLKLPARGPLLCADLGAEAAVSAAAGAVAGGAGALQANSAGPARALRSSGSAVADAHRVLQHGGLFASPAEASPPDGRLRLLYEAAPLAFLFEQAGGAAATGLHPLSGVEPVALDQRVPVFLGSREDVADVVRFYEAQAARDPALKQRCDGRLTKETRGE